MKKNDKQQQLTAFSMVGALGLSMLAAVAVAFFIGRWIDKVLHSEPWGTVIGLFLGFIAGMWSIYKRIMNNE